MFNVKLYKLKEQGVSRLMVFVIPILFVILDSVNFFIHKEVGLNNNTSISYWFKGIALVFMLTSLIAAKKHLLSDVVPILLFIFIPILWLPSFVDINLNGLAYAFYSIKEISKFMMPFILYYFFKKEKIGDRFVQRFLNFVFVSFALVSLLAFVFEIDYFRTYSNRFGYKPFIASQNESSYFFMCACFFMLHELYKYGMSIMNFAKFLLVLFGALLLGTKAIYLTLFFLLLVFLIFMRKLILVRLLFLGLLVVSFICFFIYTDLYSYFLDTYYKVGFLDTISSMRFSIFVNNYHYFIDNWQWYNYIFGGFRRPFPIFEMDIFDIFAISGILGLSLYFIIFKRIVDDIRSSQFSVILLVVFLLIGIVAGRTLNSGVDAIYLALVLYYFEQSDIKSISVFRKYSILSN